MNEIDGQLICQEESFSKSPKVDLLCLLLFSLFLCAWGLSSGPGLGDHEAIVAQGARQIRQGDGWLIPRVNDVPFVRKPPLAFWLVALSSMLVDAPDAELPVSPLAARFPSAIAGVLTTLVVYLLSRSMFGHRIGLVSGAVMASCAGCLFFSHNAQIEMVLTLFITASFAFFWFGTEGAGRRGTWMLLFYAGFALAMLAKAPLPLALLGLPLFAWWFITIPAAKLGAEPAGLSMPGSASRRVWRQFRRLKELRLVPGLVLFLVLFLPWPVYVYLKVENVWALWELEFLDRYTGGLSPKARPFWYYVPIAFALMLPFSLSLPEAVASPFLRFYRDHRRALLYVFTWAVVQIVFLSTSAFKRPHYLLACVPALAILLGPTLDRLFLTARAFSRQNVRAAIVGICAGLVVGLGIGGVFLWREHPSLLWACRVGAPLLVGGVLWAGLTFTRGHRALSLLLLHGTVAVVFSWTWESLGQSRVLQREAFAMVDKLRALSIGGEDRVTWVKGRPDARLMYYMGRRINPLFSPLELAARREGRQFVPRALLVEGGERLVERLRSDQEEYFIIEGEYWERLKAALGAEIPAREVFRVPVGPDRADDWVLITNSWNMGEEEDFVTTRAAPHTMLEPFPTPLPRFASFAGNLCKPVSRP